MAPARRHQARKGAGAHHGARRAAVIAAAGLAAVAGSAWARHMRAGQFRRWRPGRGSMHVQGDVAWRAFGDGPDTVVLLHGLPGTNVVWGHDFDQLGARARVIVPDLPGFGGSMHAAAPEHAIDDVVDELDVLLDGLGVPHGRRPGAGPRLVLVGHSYGSLVALAWAARRGDVDAAMLVCPPFFSTAADGRERIARMARFAGWFAHETVFAQLASEALGRVRPLARFAAPIAAPHLPVAVARSGLEHTWASYLGALRTVLGCEWQAALDATLATGTAVHVVEGDADVLTIGGVGAQVAATHDGVTYEELAGAAHELPMSHGEQVAEIALRMLDQV